MFTNDKLKEKVKEIVEGELTVDEHTIAKLLMDVYGSVYRCTSLENNTWYQFIDNCWVLVDSIVYPEMYLGPKSLRLIMSGELSIEFGKHQIYLYDLAKQKNGYDREKCISESARISKIIKEKLDSSTFKNKVIEAFAEYAYDPDFLKKLQKDIDGPKTLPSLYDRLQLNNYGYNIQKSDLDRQTSLLAAVHDYSAQLVLCKLTNVYDTYTTLPWRDIYVKDIEFIRNRFFGSSSTKPKVYTVNPGAKLLFHPALQAEDHLTIDHAFPIRLEEGFSVRFGTGAIFYVVDSYISDTEKLATWKKQDKILYAQYEEKDLSKMPRKNTGAKVTLPVDSPVFLSNGLTVKLANELEGKLIRCDITLPAGTKLQSSDGVYISFENDVVADFIGHKQMCNDAICSPDRQRNPKVDEIYRSFVQKIMELLGVDEETAKFYRSAIKVHIENTNPELRKRENDALKVKEMESIFENKEKLRETVDNIDMDNIKHHISKRKDLCHAKNVKRPKTYTFDVEPNAVIYYDHDHCTKYLLEKPFKIVLQDGFQVSTKEGLFYVCGPLFKENLTLSRNVIDEKNTLESWRLQEPLYPKIKLPKYIHIYTPSRDKYVLFGRDECIEEVRWCQIKLPVGTVLVSVEAEGNLMSLEAETIADLDCAHNIKFIYDCYCE